MPAVLLILLFFLAILVTYRLVIFLSKLFVYLGFNLFLFTDNLLHTEPANPIVLWGLWGLLTGSIVGVIIAVKKYKLSKVLILYPVSFTIVVFLLLFFINRPTESSGSFSLENQEGSTSNQAQQSRIFYTVTRTVNVRSLPSAGSAIRFRLAKGTQVEFIENALDNRNRNRTWTKIIYTDPQTGDQKVGYVNASYLSGGR